MIGKERERTGQGKGGRRERMEGEKEKQMKAGRGTEQILDNTGERKNKQTNKQEELGEEQQFAEGIYL